MGNAGIAFQNKGKAQKKALYVKERGMFFKD